MNIYSSKLKRIDLIKLSKIKADKKIIINVFRNHSFEPIGSILNAYLSHYNLNAEINYSSYDNSIPINDSYADLNILFIDTNNYNDNIDYFIEEKIKEINNIYNIPLLVLLLGNTSLTKYSLEEILKDYMDINELIDIKNFEITASRLSNNACINIAKLLGLKIIPSYYVNKIKAIIVDLDNTLYDGILSEDGIENLTIDNYHKEIYALLKSYHEIGIPICISSKNDMEDVINFFSNRHDFPLKETNFTLIKANWNHKKESITEIKNFINIGYENILFVDDNIAEIENVKELNLNIIHATSSQDTYFTLKYYPGLFVNNTLYEDTIRIKDLKANEQRKQLEKLDDKTYFSNLNISLYFEINNPSNLERAFQLFNKTNQFISNFTRYSLEEYKNFINNNSKLITIKMHDKLSESGIISAIICHKESNNLFIDDFCISCRALGRKIEKIILFKSIEIVKIILNTNNTILYYKIGTRNQPFLDFIDSIECIKENGKIIIKDYNLMYEGLNIESKIY